MKRIFAVLLVVVFSSGCASTQHLKPQDRDQIKSVAVHGEVLKSPTMYYMGPEAAAGALFGVVGALATAQTSLDSGEALKLYAEQNDIFIENIVREEVVQALKDTNKLPLVDKAEDANTFINVGVNIYGFSVPTAFSSSLVPIITVTCTMVDSEGNLIWKASDGVLTLGNPADAISIDGIKNDPSLIEKSWRIATREIASNIVAEL